MQIQPIITAQQQQQSQPPSTNFLPLTKTTKLPTLHQKPSYNQIYIKSNRPLKVYLKHSMKVLQKTNILIIHGMTSTITKAIRLSIMLRKQFPYLKYKMVTDSVPVINKVQCEIGRTMKGREYGQQQFKYKQQKKQSRQVKYELKQRSCIHIILQKNFVQKKQKNM